MLVGPAAGCFEADDVLDSCEPEGCGPSARFSTRVLAENGGHLAEACRNSTCGYAEIAIERDYPLDIERWLITDDGEAGHYLARLTMVPRGDYFDQEWDITIVWDHDPSVVDGDTLTAKLTNAVTGATLFETEAQVTYASRFANEADCPPHECRAVASGPFAY